MYRILLYPTGRAVSVLIMRGRINATSIVYLNDYDMFFSLYIYMFHGGRLYTYAVICYWLFMVLWDYIACLNLSFGNPVLQNGLYSDTTWASWRHKSASHLLFFQQYALANNKRKIQTLLLET